jgi:hypothetical protein
MLYFLKRRRLIETLYNSSEWSLRGIAIDIKKKQYWKQWNWKKANMNCRQNQPYDWNGELVPAQVNLSESNHSAKSASNTQFNWKHLCWQFISISFFASSWYAQNRRMHILKIHELKINKCIWILFLEKLFSSLYSIYDQIW